jgi:uncharacterized ion transporter superfamily protein YfcC
MKIKLLLLILVVLVSTFHVDAYADTVKKKCPKKVYVPGSKQYKGKKCPKKSKIKNTKYY